MVGFVLTRFVDLSAIETLSLEDLIKCSICLQVLDNAVDTRCGHTFCRECLNEWLSRPQTTKECPECRQLLPTRKRTRSQITADNTSVIGGNVLVEKSLRINAMIGKLKIRCDYEWNGCPEVCPLESLSTHLKTCEYRLCLTCGLSIGPIIDDHNCIEGLKTDRNEWQTKCNERIEKDKEFEAKTKEMVTKVRDLVTKLKRSEEKSLNFESKYKETDGLHKILVQKYSDLEGRVKTQDMKVKLMIPLAVIPKCLLFGKFETNVGSIEFNKYGIVFNNIVSIHLKVPSIVRLCLKYNEIQCLMACHDPSRPMLCMKLMKDRAFEVDAKDCSITELIDKCYFDCNSEDSSERFIIIELREVLNETFVAQLCAKCKDRVECETINTQTVDSVPALTNNTFEYNEIDSIDAQLMLMRAMNAIN